MTSFKMADEIFHDISRHFISRDLWGVNGRSFVRHRPTYPTSHRSYLLALQAKNNDWHVCLRTGAITNCNFNKKINSSKPSGPTRTYNEVYILNEVRFENISVHKMSHQNVKSSLDKTPRYATTTMPKSLNCSEVPQRDIICQMCNGSM